MNLHRRSALTVVVSGIIAGALPFSAQAAVSHAAAPALSQRAVGTRTQGVPTVSKATSGSLSTSANTHPASLDSKHTASRSTSHATAHVAGAEVATAVTSFAKLLMAASAVVVTAASATATDGPSAAPQPVRAAAANAATSAGDPTASTVTAPTAPAPAAPAADPFAGVAPAPVALSTPPAVSIPTTTPSVPASAAPDAPAPVVAPAPSASADPVTPGAPATVNNPLTSLLATAQTLTTAGTAAAAGALTGPLSTFAPTGAGTVPVAVGQLNQALVNSSPATATFVLAAGTHRLTSPLTPKAGQKFLGLPGAVISGSVVLSGWKQSGGTWTVGGQTQRLPRESVSGYTICQAAHPLCNNAEEVFLDGTRLTPVASLGAVTPGSFFFDYTNSTITLADNPTGHVVETSMATAAFANAMNNTISNLVIQEFGNESQVGVISGVNLTIDHDTVQLNHGGGVGQFGGSITNSRILRNGQIGLGGGGTDLLVDDDEIAYNNADGYDPAWEAGGAKWTRSTGLVVSHVWSHDNDGAGFGTDINNVDTTYEYNVVENNAFMGIAHEISGSAKIIDNIVRNNGTAAGWFTSRVGIEITDSSDVEVAGNLISNNGGGGILAEQDARAEGNGPGSWQVRNVSVHDNVITVNAVPTPYSPVGNGISVDDGVPNPSQYFAAAMGNTFAHNAYTIPASGFRNDYFRGASSPDGSGLEAFADWKNSGQDAGSTWTGA